MSDRLWIPGTYRQQSSIATGPLNSAEAYLMRGDEYADIKDYAQAVADYTQAIQLKPDYAEAYNM